MSEAYAFVDASSDESMLSCTASAWKGDKDSCRWCNSMLPGMRRRWCSDECAASFGRNHWWTSASRAAVKRDGRRCVRCGATELDPRRRKGKTSSVYLEVHHKIPVKGRHSVSGCHHHLDGLETLCCDCHLDEHHGEPPDQLSLPQAALRGEALP